MPDATPSDFPLVRRPAIKAGAPRRFGDVTLEAIGDGTILELLGKPGTAEIVGALQTRGPFSVRTAGPGQWFAVSDRSLAPGEIDDCTKDIAAIASVVDQSHGRVRIRVSGAPVRSVLAKGTGVDLHPAAFPLGRAAMTLIGHIGVNLARTAADTFEVLVLRSFAEDLWHELETMSAEFA
jgi:sarcosine oxidase subunit gamma